MTVAVPVPRVRLKSARAVLSLIGNVGAQALLVGVTSCLRGMGHVSEREAPVDPPPHGSIDFSLAPIEMRMTTERRHHRFLVIELTYN